MGLHLLRKRKRKCNVFGKKNYIKYYYIIIKNNKFQQNQLNQNQSCDSVLSFSLTKKIMDRFEGIWPKKRIILCKQSYPANSLRALSSKSDCIYHFPIDLVSNGRPFGSKSIRKWKTQSDFGLI